MAEDIESGCYLFQAQSQTASKNISRDILLSGLSAACNYAFKMFNVCKCISRFRS